MQLSQTSVSAFLSSEMCNNSVLLFIETSYSIKAVFIFVVFNFIKWEIQ